MYILSHHNDEIGLVEGRRRLCDMRRFMERRLRVEELLEELLE